MVPLVRKVMKQTRARILRGDGKLVSLFEPETEIIRKGNAGKPILPSDSDQRCSRAPRRA
jgi:transposase, IS5 family